MRKIYKYQIPNYGFSNVQMPVGAKIVAVQPQRGYAMMWAEVDPDAPTEERKFLIVGTGQPLTEDAKTYVGTIQDGGGFVWHVYECAS